MEEIEEIQEVDRPVTTQELKEFLSDKFDIQPGRIERKQTVPEMIREIKDRR